LLIIVLIVGIGLVRLSPVNFGSHDKENYGEYCPTLDVSGWKKFSENFALLVKSDSENGLMKPHSPIVVNKWFPGGHIEFYTARKSGLSVLGIGNLDDLHKFAWLNKERKGLQLGDDAYCIVPSNLPIQVADIYERYFSTIEKPIVIDQKRNGGVVRYFYIYRLKQCKQIPVSGLK